MLVQMHLLVEQETALAGAVRQRQVLQRALAALVAYRAVQRVRGQQELQRLFCPACAFSDCVSTTMPSETGVVQAVSSLAPNCIFG